MKKVFHSAEQAIDGLIFDGMKIAAGGFGLCGIPEESIAALKMSGIKNLIIVPFSGFSDKSSRTPLLSIKLFAPSLS